MINYEAQLIIDKIIQIIRTLGAFTLEQLENELTIIPNSTLKEHCIEYVLNSSEIEQVFEIYYFSFTHTEHMPNTDLEFQNN